MLAVGAPVGKLFPGIYPGNILFIDPQGGILPGGVLWGTLPTVVVS